MPKLHDATCLKCGADLRIARDTPVVTCHYCGHQAMIDWVDARRAPPQQTIDASRMQIRLDPSASRALILGIVGTAVVPAVIGVLVSVIGVATSSTSRTSGSRITIPGAPALGLPSAGVPVAAANPREVDVADLVRQARGVALAEQPKAELANVVAFQVVGGVVDTTSSNAASIDFIYRYNDATKPPGKDLVEGTVSVHAANGALARTLIPRHVRAPRSRRSGVHIARRLAGGRQERRPRECGDHVSPL